MIIRDSCSLILSPYSSVAPPRFYNSGEVRYGSIGGLEYEVPQSRLCCLCILYQRGSLLDGLAMYLSRDTKKFHDNESTHVLHNFWTSTHRGGRFPPSRSPGGATDTPAHPVVCAGSRHRPAACAQTSISVAQPGFWASADRSNVIDKQRCSNNRRNNFL